MAQLDPMKVILVFSHEHNTFDKRFLLSNLGRSDSNMRVSEKTVADFIQDPELLQFYMCDVDAALRAYEPGHPSMKPDVLQQIREKMHKHAHAHSNIPVQTQNQIQSQSEGQMNTRFLVHEGSVAATIDGTAAYSQLPYSKDVSMYMCVKTPLGWMRVVRAAMGARPTVLKSALTNDARQASPMESASVIS